ncbi:MAG: sensor histidine kinase [Planctomycetota bacterium]|nr:MAG: sensor histidine kinase [Planctomycetota bacterium]
MSYRGFKRVLGETSLERKCRFLFGACLLMLITASFVWYGRRNEQLVYEQARVHGDALATVALYTIHWNAWETDVRQKDNIAQITQNLRNQPFAARFIRAPENMPKVVSERPGMRPEDVAPRDAFERALLQRFADIGEARQRGERNQYEFEERRIEDTREYQYYRPIYAEQSCYHCHKVMVPGYAENPGFAQGDLMAVVMVQFSDEETHHALSLNRAILYATAIITVFLAMLLLYVVVRYVIVKPLKHLREVADEVSRGNLVVRAEIHTADEFEEVGAAFNRMLRHLIAAQDELRHVNVDLDGKVDQLAQANLKLHELNRLKSDFLATMSHELRTPLNSIIGFSDVLAAIDSLDERQRRYVLNIQKSGRMLLEMINDILDLAKIESGRMEVRLTDFRIDAVISAQCDMARPLAERKNIDLDVEIAAELPEMHQDQAKVQQILNNLLSNAIKFTPEGGRITVSAVRHASGELALVVADTGVGIAPEDQHVIFEKFRQGATALTGGDAITREHSGTGLGLSIVKEMCKLLGGEISLVSELGKGSTFTVRLPWRLADRPRLVSPMAEDADELTKLRPIDAKRLLEVPSPDTASSEEADAVSAAASRG